MLVSGRVESLVDDARFNIHGELFGGSLKKFFQPVGLAVVTSWALTDPTFRQKPNIMHFKLLFFLGEYVSFQGW